MKRTIIYLNALFILGMGVSCKKELNQLPTASLSPNTFFVTEGDLKFYTNQFYVQLPEAGFIYGETADNIVKSSVDRDIAGTRLIPTTDGRWSWANLREINFFLNSPNVQKFPNAAVRDHYVGIAKFFRAFFYFDKVRNYGDVPWYNTVIETNNEEFLMKARDPRALVMDSIMADIDYAIANLRADKNVERITKWTALALKSRIGLYEGTWRKYHTEFNIPGAEKFLNECVKASEELMNAGMYNLYNKTTGPSGKPYQDLFDNLTIDPVVEEVILGRRYSNELELRHGLQFYITARTQGKPGFEKRLVNSYLMQDGTPFTSIPGYDTLQFYDEVQNRDPRLSQSIRTPGYKRIGSTTTSSVDFEANMTGYQPIKWMNITALDGNGQSYQDMAIFRLGEVLLNFAEAKAELGTLTQSDLNKSIKLLRDRVNMPNLDMAVANANPDPYQAKLYPGISNTNKGVLLEIRRERRVELVMENDLRWEDLMRWKEGHLLADPYRGTYFPGDGFYDLDKNGTPEIEIYSGAKPPQTGPYQFPAKDLSGAGKGNILTNRNIQKTFNENRDYLWPLPISELNLNPNLVQNPGWK